MPDTDSLANEALPEIMGVIEEATDLIRSQFRVPVGHERQGTRQTLATIRRAYDGDREAWEDIIDLAQAMGHQLGDNCDLCQLVNQVIAERRENESGTPEPG